MHIHEHTYMYMYNIYMYVYMHMNSCLTCMCTCSVQIIYQYRASNSTHSLWSCRPPHRISSPTWLAFREVLNEGEPSLEPHHCLINWHLTMKGVALLKICNEGLQEWSNFEQWIMAWLALRNIFLVVSQMEKLHNQAETVTLHHLSVHTCTCIFVHCIYTHHT